MEKIFWLKCCRVRHKNDWKIVTYKGRRSFNEKTQFIGDDTVNWTTKDRLLTV